MKKLLFVPFLFACYLGIGQVFDPVSIIGKPTKVENMLVANIDFPENMNWLDAKKACSELGKGWRLPNKIELNVLYKNRILIGGFEDVNYWSSTEHSIGAWLQFFAMGSQHNSGKASKYKVRAVRSI